MIKHIEIFVNGIREKVPQNSTISQLIAQFEESAPSMIVEHNGRFVYAQEYATTTVAAGSRLEFIYADFGG